MSDPIRVPASEHSRPGSFLGPEQRATAWERLGSEQFDVVVVGGGGGGFWPKERVAVASIAADTRNAIELRM